MEPELISKRELLELTGISYGQLYRWKRKDLIPEEWFIRKSTYTGQETFFPKQKILERIEKILSMKDGLSLDELADMFSPSLSEIALTKQSLLSRNIVTKITVDMYTDEIGETELFTFDRLLYLYTLDLLLKDGQISLDEGKLLLRTLHDRYPSFEGKACDLLLIRKWGVSLFLLVSGTSDIAADADARLIVRLPMARAIEELKLKLA